MSDMLAMSLSHFPSATVAHLWKRAVNLIIIPLSFCSGTFGGDALGPEDHGMSLFTSQAHPATQRIFCVPDPLLPWEAWDAQC